MRKSGCRLTAQALTVEVVDHVEQPERTTALQAVVHEVHRPDFVDRRRHRQRLRHLSNDALLRLDPQVQLQRPVDPIDPLVIPWEALDIAQKQKAQPKPPVLLVAGQADQPIGNLGVLVRQLRLIPIAVLADEKRLAGQADADRPTLDCLFGHLPATRWPQSSPSITSWRISALIRSSAYIFFRRRFSASSSLSRAISEASMPPNLARHL